MLKIRLNTDVMEEFHNIHFKYYTPAEHNTKCTNWIIKNALVNIADDPQRNIYDDLIDIEIKALMKEKKKKDPKSVSDEKKKKKLIQKNMNKFKRAVFKKIKSRKKLWTDIKKFCNESSREYTKTAVEKKNPVLNVIPKKIYAKLIGDEDYKKFIRNMILVSKIYHFFYEFFYMEPDTIFMRDLINIYIEEYFPKLKGKNLFYADGFIELYIYDDKMMVNNIKTKINPELSKRNKKMSILSLHILWEGKEDKHANMVIVDHKRKQIILIEPHGVMNYDNKMEEKKRYHVKKILNKHLKGKYSFLSFKTLIDADKLIEGIGIQNEKGLCIVYSLFITIYILINQKSNKSNQDLLRNIKQKFRMKQKFNEKINKYIRKFMYLFYKSFNRPESQNIIKFIKSRKRVKKFKY